MRFINLIVVHCSATRCDRCYTEHDLTTDHLRRGFSGAGYHFYIRKNGDIKSLRPLSLPGAHPAVGTTRASGSVTKAVLTSVVALPIHAPLSKGTLYVCLCCCC